MKQRYFIQLCFKGTGYHGWQKQQNAKSVQGVIEEALALLLKETVQVTGAGRTDTGVHATFFVAHFDTNMPIHTFSNDFIYHMNGILPDDISVQRIIPVKPTAHSRFDALSRTYQYKICREKNPFYTEYAWYVYGSLDVSLMNHCAMVIKEYSDFTSFSKLHSNTKTNNCIITEAHWQPIDSFLIFTITANRFLRNMVRSIVGTLIEAGKGKLSELDIRKIIESKNRSNAGISVPAKGLYLTNIIYPADITFI